MPQLNKATLQNLSDSHSTPVAVQFNPASLKLDLANTIEGGDTKGRQKRQFIGKSSSTLSFELHFDTADQGATDDPMSVRSVTATVEQFLVPQGDPHAKQTAARVRFHWAELIFEGIIESTSIDFDLFASNGTPLRARMSVSIKEQDAKYELLQTGPGANLPGNATLPGDPGTGPGGSVSASTNSSASALAGESAADFAVRVGLDPGAWRGIAGQIGASSSLSLQAGASIDFNTNLSASAGIGVSAGVEVGASASLGASFGLSGDGPASVGVSPAAAAGFAMSAAGGVGAAIETVAIVQAQTASDSARRSFGSAVPASAPPSVNVSAGAVAIGAASLPSSTGAAISATPGVPAPSITPKPAMPDQARTPLVLSGSKLPSTPADPPSSPPPPAADPRATSFGFGVPLRARVGSAADLRASASAGRIPLRPRAPVTSVLSSNDPTAPPWTQLPASAVQAAADKTQSTRFPSRPCSCIGRCNHGARSCQ